MTTAPGRRAKHEPDSAHRQTFPSGPATAPPEAPAGKVYGLASRRWTAAANWPIFPQGVGAAGWPAATTPGGGSDSARAVAESRRTAIVMAIESQRDSVVNIHGQKLVGGDDGAEGEVRRVNGMGTGVIIDPRGYAVTNYHVVEGVRRIEVTLASGKTTAATLVSHDPRTDLAVIKIGSDTQLPVATIGTSSACASSSITSASTSAP